MEAKTPVDVVEEFLAMQNTRKEAAERLAAPDEKDAEPFRAAKSAAEKAIAQLMDDLSQFGDAAKGAGKEDNEYDRIWNDAVAKLDTMSGEQKRQTLAQMEQALHSLYKKTLAEAENLPPATKEILEAQANQLAQNAG